MTPTCCLNLIRLVAIFFFGSLAFAAQNELPDPWAFVRGGNLDHGLDRFTRQPTQSGLSRVLELVGSYVAGDLNLEDLNARTRGLGAQIFMESDEVSAILNLYAGTYFPGSSHRLTEFPPAKNLVLKISSLNLWSNLFEGLFNEVDLVETFSTFGIRRMILQGHPTESAQHMVIARGEKAVSGRVGYVFEPPELGFTQISFGTVPRALELEQVFDFHISPPKNWLSRVTPGELPIHFFRLHPGRETLGLYKDLHWAFWSARMQGLLRSGRPFSSPVAQRLARLGFENADQIAPGNIDLGLFHSRFWLTLFAAIGYQFSPDAENLGYFRSVADAYPERESADSPPFESSRAMERYQRFILPLVADFPHVNAEAMTEEFRSAIRSYYQRIFAALKVLDENKFDFSTLPRRNDHWHQSGPFMILSSDYFHAALGKAETLYPTELSALLVRGPEVRWDFSTETCVEALTRRPRRRLR